VSITCIDQLSPTGGSFDLRFSRASPPTVEVGEHDRFNPHEYAEPFLRGVLRHGDGRLAPSLHHLVALLRGTLAVVVELDEIRRGEAKGGGAEADTFAKAAGWYRVLYGDLR
jgi:mediator of RNA polymerase II transcription subunit 14